MPQQNQKRPLAPDASAAYAWKRTSDGASPCGPGRLRSGHSRCPARVAWLYHDSRLLSRLRAWSAAARLPSMSYSSGIANGAPARAGHAVADGSRCWLIHGSTSGVWRRIHAIDERSPPCRSCPSSASRSPATSRMPRLCCASQRTSGGVGLCSSPRSTHSLCTYVLACQSWPKPPVPLAPPHGTQRYMSTSDCMPSCAEWSMQRFMKSHDSAAPPAPQRSNLRSATSMRVKLACEHTGAGCRSEDGAFSVSVRVCASRVCARVCSVCVCVCVCAPLQTRCALPSTPPRTRRWVATSRRWGARQ